MGCSMLIDVEIHVVGCPVDPHNLSALGGAFVSTYYVTLEGPTNLQDSAPSPERPAEPDARFGAVSGPDRVGPPRI